MNIEIRGFRKSKGWTQGELAKRLGVGQGAVSNIERGARGISKPVALRLNKLDQERFPLKKLLDTSADGRTCKERVPMGEVGFGSGSGRPDASVQQEEVA